MDQFWNNEEYLKQNKLIEPENLQKMNQPERLHAYKVSKIIQTCSDYTIQ